MHILSGSDYSAVFGRKAEIHCFAPGRVNLIGEHTDYNGGHVFPCALSYGTYAAAAKRKDDKLRFYNYAQGSLEECRCYIILGYDLSYIDQNESDMLMQEIEETSKFLNSYM